MVVTVAAGRGHSVSSGSEVLSIVLPREDAARVRLAAQRDSRTVSGWGRLVLIERLERERPRVLTSVGPAGGDDLEAA